MARGHGHGRGRGRGHGTGAPVYAKRPLSVKGMLPLTRNTTFRTLTPAGATMETPLPSPVGQPDPNAKLADRNF